MYTSTIPPAGNAGPTLQYTGAIAGGAPVVMHLEADARPLASLPVLPPIYAATAAHHHHQHEQYNTHQQTAQIPPSPPPVSHSYDPSLSAATTAPPSVSYHTQPDGSDTNAANHVELISMPSPPYMPPLHGGPFLTPMQLLFQDVQSADPDTDPTRAAEDGGTDFDTPEPDKAQRKSSAPTDREELTRGLKIAGVVSACLAVCICVGGSFILSWNSAALTDGLRCNTLFVWGLLFVVFEGFYFIGIVVHGCFSDESFHTKRFKTAVLLILFCMSVLFFIWGTILINTSQCPETKYATLWLYFRVLYWFIIGVWSLVLVILSLPVILFFVLRTYMNRTDK